MGILSDLRERLNQEDTKRSDDGGMEKAEGVKRLFFATDVHGSTVCWRKFCNAAEFYSADVLVLGGDTTGKAILPIVRENGTYRIARGDKEETIETEEELEETKETYEDRGFYPYVLDQDEYESLKAEDSRDRQDEIFEREMEARIREWIDMADPRVPDDVPIYVSPGNDDPFSIDEVWEQADRVDLVEGEVVELPQGYEMVSTGWTNPTPWDTPREEPDEQLEQRLERAIEKMNRVERGVFNFHVPPYDSQLDSAPELDEDLKPKYGGQSMEPVGSKAVGRVIEKHQPPLSLHGHIHESRGKTKIGETIAINPGSAYSEGSLQGAIIDFRPEIKVVGLVRG